MQITLSDGSIAQVDRDDGEALLYRWTLAGGRQRKGKYASRRVRVDGKGTTLYLHRWVAHRMGLIPAAIGGGRSVPSVDHANGDKLDNRRANLRLRTRPEQMRNPNDALRSTNRSGYRGVSLCHFAKPRPKQWMAYVTVSGKTINLGWYATAEQAAEARRAWDAEHRA